MEGEEGGGLVESVWLWYSQRGGEGGLKDTQQIKSTNLRGAHNLYVVCKEGGSQDRTKVTTFFCHCHCSFESLTYFQVFENWERGGHGKSSDKSARSWKSRPVAANNSIHFVGKRGKNISKSHLCLTNIIKYGILAKFQRLCGGNMSWWCDMVPFLRYYYHSGIWQKLYLTQSQML